MPIDWTATSALLNAKLDRSNIQPAKKFGPKGDYIEGWLAIAEANRIFGFGGWSDDLVAITCVCERPREIGQNPPKPGWGVTYTAKVRVTVEGVTREDVGAGHGYDVDCGLAHESAIKEAATDALKRTLRTFGNPFGLALYDKSRENVGDVEADKRKEPKPKQTPEQTSIIWLRDAASLEALNVRWKKLAENSPEVANDPDVEAAYHAQVDKFSPFPGDQVQRAADHMAAG